MPAKMPTTPRREDALIRMFLSVHEDGSWASASLDWRDQKEDGAVEVIAQRADGMTLAIEHTLIESYPGEREEFERFRRAVLPVERDPRLESSGRIVYVDVPRDFLPKGERWQDIADALREWLVKNISRFGDGQSTPECTPCLAAGAADATLSVRVETSDASVTPVIIRRYGSTDIGASVSKALTMKMPKLLKTTANRRLLMLERNQFSLSDADIMRCVDEQLSNHVASERVDVWLVETVFYDGYLVRLCQIRS